MNLHYDKQRSSYRILWSDRGRRCQLFLGKVSEQQAAEVLRHCRTLLAFKHVGGLLDSVTVRWCQELDSELRSKLAKLGMLDSATVAEPLRVGELFERFFAERSVNWQPSTRQKWEQAKTYAVAHFGERHIADIRPAHAAEYHAYLVNRPLNSATTRKAFDNCRAVFRFAERRKLIAENPLEEHRVVMNHNRSRHHYVDKAAIDMVAEYCDPETRLVLFLSRYAGLRVDSETKLLQWRFVDLSSGWLTVRTKKLETRSMGKAERKCPIFPRLRTEIERYRRHVGDCDPDQLLFTYTSHPSHRLAPAIKQAGVKQWPKLFINLRASCLTDLGRTYSESRVARWLGTGLGVVQTYSLERDSLDVRTDPFADIL